MNEEFEAGINAVTSIRCMEHRAVPKYNTNVIGNAECAACAVEEVERAKEKPVCDCHTWPTVKEMHDYLEACENRIVALQAENERLRKETHSPSALQAERLNDRDTAQRAGSKLS